MDLDYVMKSCDEWVESQVSLPRETLESCSNSLKIAQLNSNVLPSQSIPIQEYELNSPLDLDFSFEELDESDFSNPQIVQQTVQIVQNNSFKNSFIEKEKKSTQNQIKLNQDKVPCAHLCKNKQLYFLFFQILNFKNLVDVVIYVVKQGLVSKQHRNERKRLLFKMKWRQI